MEKSFYQIGRVHFYETIDQQNKNKSQRKNLFRCKSSKITNSMRIWMDANKKTSFPSRQNTSLLGCFAFFDENDEFCIGYKMIPC